MVHKRKKIRGMIDVIQEAGRKLKRPQIRVWCHPTKGGDDYYYVFNSVPKAYGFIFKVASDPKRLKKEVPEIHPLVAYKGYEMRIPDFIRQFPKEKLRWE